MIFIAATTGISHAFFPAEPWHPFWRAIAVPDSFDTMSSDRPFRTGMLAAQPRARCARSF
jgi:hypothetical protein